MSWRDIQSRGSLITLRISFRCGEGAERAKHLAAAIWLLLRNPKNRQTMASAFAIDPAQAVISGFSDWLEGIILPEEEEDEVIETEFQEVREKVAG